MPILKFKDNKFLPNPFGDREGFKEVRKSLNIYTDEEYAHMPCCKLLKMRDLFPDCSCVVNQRTKLRCADCLFSGEYPTPLKEINKRIVFAYRHYYSLITSVQNEVIK